MSSDNPTGAENQQGRLPAHLPPEYIAGFVDGEGCFSVSIKPHPTVRYGTHWLIAPRFQVYQHRESVRVLEMIRDDLGCGKITEKSGSKNVMTLTVHSRDELEKVIIPFFDRHLLRSEKRNDFLKFREIILSMQRKEHRTPEGFRRIVELAFSMNGHGRQRRHRMEDVLAEPSETVRQAPQATRGDETVRPSWRREEGDRNDHPATRT